MADENYGGALVAAHVALLRRSARTLAPDYLLGDDAGQRAAAIRDLLGRRAGNYGGGEPRRGGSGRPVGRAQHSAAARTVVESVHFAGAEFLFPLFLHAQTVVRANGQGLDRFSRRLRDYGRIVGNVDAIANQQAVFASLDSDLRPGILGQSI